MSDEFCGEAWDGGEIAGCDSGEECGDGWGTECAVSACDKFSTGETSDGEVCIVEVEGH